MYVYGMTIYNGFQYLSLGGTKVGEPRRLPGRTPGAQGRRPPNPSLVFVTDTIRYEQLKRLYP